jgi:hypothetical protein
MRELVSLRRCSMWYVGQELWWYWAVKDKITIEQLYFLDGFPSPDGRRRWCRSRFVLIVIIHIGLLVRVRAIGIVSLQNRYLVIVVV